MNHLERQRAAMIEIWNATVHFRVFWLDTFEQLMRCNPRQPCGERCPCCYEERCLRAV